MTKVTMPEPVTHYRGMQYYTAEMLEAYAAAKVRDALESAADIADSMDAFATYDAIRTLIPK